MCVVFSHGRPNSKGYAPCTFNWNTIADIQKACPPIVTSNSRMSPVGRTKLVSAILNQKGHSSQSRIPKVSHVLLLITFTPEPLSIIVPAISLPLTITIIDGLLVSTTAGPSSRLEKNVGAGSGFGSMTVVLSPTVNQGTNCSRLPNHSTI